jgi:YhcH/YjgK/YiaL family protein
MILDTLDNARKYFSLHPLFEQAFQYISSQNLQTLEAGKFEIKGKDLHGSVSSKDGVKTEDAKFEAHNNYVDIQVCPAGKETIGWSPRKKCVDPKGEYNAEKDVTFFNDKPETYFELHEGQFAIFFPEDVHAPMIGDEPITKLVLKVKL